ncbi:hypothetical protein N825_05485 [Skermanella stibiiresistens SB22]|uniref:PRC-barrel domain-containing protein n=1 Tax=Skermanella stibiiresistens SB22 TaxID=1385369 RepID=W9H4A7_9PROT|nr:PRC-barrel domain-containing protein [Skermanella stibiiresistens]EWY39552.1 hypothetical protein N825_05485 [Skermanella stibiiresistens SB22]
MRSPLLYTASILTLLAGPALAQTTESNPPGHPASNAPAFAVEAPSGGPAMGTAPDTSAEALREQPTETAAPGAVSVSDMMGRTVRGSDGESLGSVEDVIIDPQSGEARQLVISSGGFLGIGAKQIAVDLASANLGTQENDLLLPNMAQADIEALPEFEMEEGMTTFNTRPTTETEASDTTTTQ